jgi:hypothetical protein
MAGAAHTIVKHPHIFQRIDICRAQRTPFSDRGGEGMAVIGVDDRFGIGGNGCHGMVDEARL